VIEIDGSAEDETAVNSWIAKLQEAFDERDYSPSPFLGPNDPYKGHIFWDADVWLFPAMALIDPDRASKVPRTRLEWRIEYGADKLFWEVDERNNGVRVKVAELHRSHIGSAWWMLQRANALGMTPKDWRFDLEQFPVEASSYYKQPPSSLRVQDAPSRGFVSIRNPQKPQAITSNTPSKRAEDGSSKVSRASTSMPRKSIMTCTPTS